MVRIFLLPALLLLSHMSLALNAGDKAPDFRLPLLTQTGQVSLSAYKGKVVYLDFWASWCGPCRKSLPALDQIHKELKGKGFEVLAVNLDEDIKDGRAFLKDYPVGYTTLHDAAGKTPDAFGLRGMPTAYLIGRDGKIHAVHEGFKPSDAASIRTEILNLLQAK